MEWFLPVGYEPDDDTGMWIVEPEFDENGQRPCEIIHLDSVVRSVHLIGVYGNSFVPLRFNASDSLDAFRAFYVNKFADYHSHENVF